MQDTTTLEKAQALLHESKQTELGVADRMPLIAEFRSEISTLKMAMYEAKREAAEKAAAPYQETIDDLESQIATMMALIA